MNAFPRLVLTSGNECKLREFRRLLAPLGIEVIAANGERNQASRVIEIP